MTPTLTTPRLSLRPLLHATPRQVRWLNTPEVVQYSEQRHKSHSLETQTAYIMQFPGKLWKIMRVDNEDHIGNISATNDTMNGLSEIGILIGEHESWNKGYGREAWEEVCRWMLEGSIRKLEAGCMANNIGMLRILAHSGFVYEGERLNHFLFNGMPVGMKLFGRFR